MLKQRCILITILGLAISVSATAVADPPERSWQVRGDSANGHAYDNDGCSYRTLDIGGSEEATHERGGRPVREAAVWAGYSSQDWCTGVQTAGFVFDSSATFTGSLHAASAAVSIPVDSYRCHADANNDWVCDHIGSGTVSVTVDWSAFGDTFRGINRSIAHSSLGHLHARWNGQFREATMDVDALVDGVSLTFGHGFGTIGTYNSGETELVRQSRP
jgi:hypothetical protein